jgi:hypothetical protein
MLPFVALYEWKSWVHSPPGERDLISGILLIGFFYLNYYKLIPLFYFKGRKFGIFDDHGCFIVINIPSQLTGRYHQPPDFPRGQQQVISPACSGSDTSMAPPPHGILNPAPGVLFIIVFLFAMGLVTHDRWRMEEKGDQDRVTLLKAQINPHFLFNAMNGIYSALEVGVRLQSHFDVVVHDALHLWQRPPGSRTT